MGAIYFGTDGWRSVIADKFTFENVGKISQAFSNYLEAENKLQQGVAVSYDTRFLSDRFARRVAEVLASNKIPVFLSKQYTPTPVLSFAVKKRRLAAGMMVTASHNPYFYNGIKFKGEYGGPALPSITSQIESFLEQMPVQHETGRITQNLVEIDFFPEYQDHLRNFLDFNLLSSFSPKVLYDPLFAAGCGYLDYFLKDSGISYESIHCHPDPYFGQLLPEPIPANLLDLKNAVKDLKAQIGLATDGDADRFGVIDEQGNFIELHDLLPLLFTYLVDSRGWTGQVVRTTSLADTIDRVASEKNRKVIEVPVGFRNITAEMLQTDILIGGEESGGFGFKNHLPERDGILSCLLLLEMLAKYKVPLSELISNLRQKFGPFYYGRLDKYFDLDLLQRNLQLLQKAPPAIINKIAVQRISLLDGIKFYLDDNSWLLMRVSQTEPLMRIYVAARAPEKVPALLAAGTELMTKQSNSVTE